ncbi:hypothetical protein PPL_12067 [Heterostelium album PN500]|uniref:Uncharacterized protein n=1 Tax=Heterostelium pallidum (strain ATCC 26659 / Pp 5 / PN500) TaxID=670386 RepID=D3BLL4_HETP5|nr:hypothetical protein PPL_12067 [Heterostelium album PN500]EFA77465.1 hypothetical protein PPL_12067 [Heterostelium album PN500]|eukprot:XP_020429593.1 hypothetical protein PPL_12067 [Heterostelium album PN500]
MSSEQLKDIPPNVGIITIDSDDSDYEQIYKKISRSNVTELNNCHTLMYKLPENITSLSFSSTFNQSLLPSTLPKQLKILNLKRSNFNHPIRYGMIPNTLEKLYLDSSYDQPLEPGVLPSSLKHLFYYGNHNLKVGSLPPNLKVFEYYGDNFIIENEKGILPMTLESLIANILWLPAIKSLSNLKSLTLLYYGNSEAKIDLTLLPSSLTTLNVHTGHLISKMPTSIKQLNLFAERYDIEEIFKDRSEYKLEYLMVNANQYESLDNLKIKELDFAIDFGSNETNVINEIKKVPKGVEKLVIRHGISLSIKNIPSSVRCLEIQSLNSLIIEEEQSLPCTLQELIINDIDHKSFLNFISHTRTPNNLIFYLQGERIWLRRIDLNYYLFFSEEPKFISSMVHKSQIHNLLEYYMTYQVDYIPKWV